MKYMILSLLFAGLLLAGVHEGVTKDAGNELLDNPDGTVYVEASGLVLETSSDEDPALGYTYSSPVERIISRGDEEAPVWSEEDWGNDVEVYPGEVGNGQDFDLDEITRDMYAICDTYHTTADSILVFHSDDDGVTWSLFSVTHSPAGELNDPKIRLARDTSGDTWVCMLYSSSSGVTMRRMRPDGTGNTYESVTIEAVDFVDMDASTGEGAYIYATWVPEGTTHVWVARNHLDGAGWIDAHLLFTNAQIDPYPAVAASTGGNVSVVFIDDRLTALPQIRITRSVNSGFTWYATEQLSSAGSANIEHTDIDYTHGSNVVGWVIATFSVSGNNDCGFYYSTNTGEDWTYGGLFPNIGSSNERLGSLRAWKCGTFDQLTVTYTVQPGDSVMYTLINASTPDLYGTPERINDFSTTQAWPSTAGWDGGGTPAVLYTNWTTNYRLMYDSYAFTGIAGSDPGPVTIRNAPNPFRTATNICFSLTQGSAVTVSIYNLTGQLVRVLADDQVLVEGSHSLTWEGIDQDGSRAPSGVYFCRLSADGINQTHRILMVR